MKILLFTILLLQLKKSFPYISRAGPREYSLDFMKEAPRILAHVFPTEAVRILNHGCWCGSLNKMHINYGNLGGALVLDKLDDICKNWFKERYRVVSKNGSKMGQKMGRKMGQKWVKNGPNMGQKMGQKMCQKMAQNMNHPVQIRQTQRRSLQKQRFRPIRQLFHSRLY